MPHDPEEMQHKPGNAALGIDRSNTILYCDRWSETVVFYRDVVGLAVTFTNDWFVEFALGPTSFLSVANAERATIGAGAGITLSWHVANLDASHNLLVERGASPGDIHTRWGARAFHLFDPDGHRIEFWTAP